jgi:hypothetical protein
MIPGSAPNKIDDPLSDGDRSGKAANGGVCSCGCFGNCCGHMFTRRPQEWREERQRCLLRLRNSPDARYDHTRLETPVAPRRSGCTGRQRRRRVQLQARAIKPREIHAARSPTKLQKQTQQRINARREVTHEQRWCTRRTCRPTSGKWRLDRRRGGTSRLRPGIGRVATAVFRFHVPKASSFPQLTRAEPHKITHRFPDEASFLTARITSGVRVEGRSLHPRKRVTIII